MIIKSPNKTASILAMLLLVASISCNEAKVDTKAEEVKLIQILKDWPKLAATGDMEKTLTYWAEDAIIMGGGQPTIHGKNEIKNMYLASLKIPGFKMVWDTVPISIKVAANGDMAYIITGNHFTMNDSTGKPFTLDNRALLVWRKEADGSWKEAVVIFNLDPAQKNK